MEKISIFNYEAFYLDFLEGNLNEEDTALLLDFLEAHPELKVDELSMPSLQQVEKELDQSFKAQLKKTEDQNGLINEESVEHYLIGELEGQLTSHEQHELDSYIAKNPHVQHQRKLFASTKLVSDRSIIYRDKKALKKRTIVLWPYISLAAAASAALLIYISGLNNDPSGKNVQIAKDNKTQPKEIKIKDQILPNQQQEEDFVTNPIVSPEVEENLVPQDLQANNEVLPNPQKTTPANWKKLPLKGVSKLITPQYDVEENLVAQNSNSNTNSEEEEDSYALVGFDDMNNPVAPITNRLGDLIKRDVDFRSAKPTEKKSGGFLLKIGKFEISHRKF